MGYYLKMIDAFYAVKGQLSRPDFDEKYSPEQAIISVTHTVVPQSTTLTVIFPFWHAPQAFNNSLEMKIQKRGTNVLLYNFNPLILNKNPSSVSKSFEFITDAILHDINALIKIKGYKKVNLVGFSLGVVSLCLVAEKLPRFNEVTLIVPGDDLATSLWYGLRTKRLRNDFLRSGFELSNLQTSWHNLAPKVHVQALKKHKVHVLLAKRDRFIPYRYGRNLYELLNAQCDLVTCQITPYGHVATIWQYLQAA